MAVTINEQGGHAPLPGRPVSPRQQPAPAALPLAFRLAEYKVLLRKDRRRRYLGMAAIGVGLLWLGLAALYYFDAGFPYALLLGLALTILMPLAALLYESLRQPSTVDTARTLDSLLDNRQRVLTSVELLNKPKSEFQNPKSKMEEAQLNSTANLLTRVEPRTLYPAKMPAAQLSIAGGLLVVALGMWLLKGANDSFALTTGGLPQSMNPNGLVATPTADPGLPGAAEGAQAEPPDEQPGEEGQLAPSTLPGVPEGGGSGSSGNTGQVSPEVAQQQAAASREAEKSLQRLSQALDEQGVTQDIADSLRQGDYGAAGDALSELGENNDQLSREAKEALTESLEKAANDSAGTPELQQAERNAAEALRNGTYGEIKKALEELGEAVKETGDDVIPQQELAQNFPTPSAGSAAGVPTPGGSDPTGQSQDGQTDQAGEPGEQGQPGDPNSGGVEQPDASGNGQQAQPGEGSNGSPSNNAGNSPGQPGEQGQGSGAGDAGLPGEGSRVDGPRGQDLDAAGDPFDLEGNEAPDPNNLRPGDGSEPPAMTLEGDSGNAGGATGPSQGGPIDATGETAPPPIDRWGILQRYFSPNAR